MSKINIKALFSVTLRQALPYILIVCGIIGLLASFDLTYEKIQVLENPHHVPACSLNPIISCGSVMNAAQSNFLGIPNTVFGLIAFSMLVAFGFMLLAAEDMKFKRWLWVCAQLAATGGVLGAHYLIYQSVFNIHAICPWCFVTWLVTFLVFWATTIYNLQEGNFGKWHRYLNIIGDTVQENALSLLALWYLVIFGLLLVKFWYYWSTLI
ncbi:MAG TPA: vitamin K epoxide reductase family protein [Patescibacteria group bacterium]|nr:vitamin K epoxide reductase family protein [Patescibacteria group bacterium]